MNLDSIDLAILDHLQRDGRMTQASLAKAVNLAPASLLARLRKLQDSGMVKEVVARLDRVALGYGLLVFVQVSLALHRERPIERFRKAMRDLPEVQECHHVSGEFDFLLKVVVKDMADYERFVRERLTRVEGVGKLESCFVLHTSKEKCSIPLHFAVD